MWRNFCFFAVCIPKFCSMMNENNKFVRFDWAAKRMLRDKANFGVLEGLLTVLLGEKITIEQILESEANQNTCDDKFNRVDIKALNSKGEIIIVEIQNTLSCTTLNVFCMVCPRPSRSISLWAASMTA